MINRLSPIDKLRRRYPDVPQQCFACKEWNTQFPNACSRFYSEAKAWQMPGGCPAVRKGEVRE